MTNGIRKGRVQGIIYIDEGQLLSPKYLFSKCSSVKGLQKHLQIPLSQALFIEVHCLISISLNVKGKVVQNTHNDKLVSNENFLSF